MSKKVLVIDDEKAIRNSFLLTFEDSGIKIEVAENGATGLKKIQDEHYDLIFLDLKMPDLSGAEVLTQIREKDEKVSVYIITAFHSEFMSELKEARDNGFDFELLQKPLNAPQLKNIVNSILGL